jgi:alkylhydroperoxidase family enzyme
VEAVLCNIDTAPLASAEKALLRFVELVNTAAPSVGPEHIAALRSAGWTDEAIYDAITVCALFNFYNRWNDATGVPAMSDEAHHAAAHRMAAGYIRTSSA